VELRSTLLQIAAGRPHVLVAAAAGAPALRLAVEHELTLRQWPLAGSAAEAGMLVVCGGERDPIAPYAEQVWESVPAPRVQAPIGSAAAVEHRLDDAQRRLAAGAVAVDAPGGGHRAHQGHELAGHGGHDMGGHGGHDMGAMEVEGLPLADRAPDRDGLRLDRLQVTLGPILRGWPPGLVVAVELQGDVIQSVELETVAAAAAAPFWVKPWLRAGGGGAATAGDGARRLLARNLDALQRLLTVAAWPAARRAAVRLRDAALADVPAAALAPQVERLAVRLERSRTLRWLTTGIGFVAPDVAEAAGAPAAAGDVDVRLRRLARDAATLARAADDASPLDPESRPGPAATALLELVPRLLAGTDLAAARLIVAGLVVDLDDAVAGVPVDG
jgi:hypothetical protein